MSIVLDFSDSPPSVTAIKAAGASGVMRYVGGDGGKHLSATEGRALLAGGVDVGGVYETTEQRCLAGYTAGVYDAADGLADLNKKLGQPARCIALAVDFDATQTQLAGPIANYFRGAVAAVGLPRVMVYGGYWSVKAILDRGLATWAWQARAWSGGNVDNRAHLLQEIGYVNVGGTQCDRNTILKTDWGQVYAHPPAPTKPPEDLVTEDDIAKIVQALLNYKLPNKVNAGDNPFWSFVTSAHYEAYNANVAAKSAVNGVAGLKTQVDALKTQLASFSASAGQVAVDSATRDAAAAAAHSSHEVAEATHREFVDPAVTEKTT